MGAGLRGLNERTVATDERKHYDKLMKIMSTLICLLALTFVAAGCSTLATAPSAAPVAELPAREIASVAVSTATCAPCENSEHYLVHLTFDDGPYKELTLKILATLKEKGVEATFFELMSAYSSKASVKALSNFDDATPAQLATILREIESGGHGLACHTLEHIDHVDLKYSLAKVDANLRRGAELSPPGSLKYLRLPYGRGWYKEEPGSAEEKRARKVMADIRKLGYKHLGWDIDSFDWSKSYHSQQPKALLADICSQKGGIILMHDIQPFEARTLANTIDSIRCSGHEIVDLKAMEELNRKRPLTSFKTRADYKVVNCPGGLKEIKTGKCLIKPN